MGWSRRIKTMGVARTAIVAVSGGVDSVVLLDMLVKKADRQLIVAHFDHGIRHDSADDARFVGELSDKYGLVYEMRREELGSHVSEAVARERRYAFLYELADQYNGTIVTAHHGDDVIETMAINLVRGTGWRGIAVFDSVIERPLLDMNKQAIIDYAGEHHLEWHEDSTNSSQKYLRNRIRAKIRDTMSDDAKRQLGALWWTQRELKRQIDAEITSFVRPDGVYDRYTITFAGDDVAEELLRAFIVAKAKQSPTRPQTKRALLAIKTAKPGTFHEVGGGVRLAFTATTFIVETL